MTTETKHTGDVIQDCRNDLLYCKTCGLDSWQAIDGFEYADVETFFDERLRVLIEGVPVPLEFLKALKAVTGSLESAIKTLYDANCHDSAADAEEAVEKANASISRAEGKA